MAVTAAHQEYHSFVSRTGAERSSKKAGLARFLGYFRECSAIADLGSGDGVFTEALSERYPDKEVVGVELNGELFELGRSSAPGAHFVKSDVIDFMESSSGRYDGYVMSDLVEHLDFDVNARILRLMPAGSVVFIKTPNTDSVLGHQYYLQVPGHKAPYSRHVLGQMLGRSGFTIFDEGRCDGVFEPASLAGRMRRALIRLLFIDEYERLFGGGNIYIAARKGRARA